MIRPHGNKLINRNVSSKRRKQLINEYQEMSQLSVSNETVEDLFNIGFGVFSPLKGFMFQEDINSIIERDRLANDLPWTIPITLNISMEKAKNYSPGEEIALIDQKKELIAVLSLEEIFDYEKEKVAKSVFQTLDSNHPGVADVMQSEDKLLAGKIELINGTIQNYKDVTLYPKDTRALFKKNKWKKVVGFQTRNVPHLGHEYVQKTALSLVDGLFINPIIGKKKKNDFLDPIILGAYKILMQDYYREDKALLGILRTRMRYGGPKEAIFHAIMRKNFGCTHFIVGRDHAGVGDYYGPFEAHAIFQEFPDLGIQPICFRSFFICSKCGGVVNDNCCPHDGTKYQEFISGRKIRKMLINKQEKGLTNYMRSEVANYLLTQNKLFVE